MLIHYQRETGLDLAEQFAEIGIEQAILWINRLAINGELLEPRAEGAPDLVAGQERRLVEQRHAAPVAAELVVVAQELLPFRPPGGSGVDAERRSLPAIGEKRFDIARDGIADARQIAAVARRLLVVEAEIAILVEHVEEAALAECPHAEQVFVVTGLARIEDDLRVRPGAAAAHHQHEPLAKQEEVQLVGERAELWALGVSLDP